MRFLEYRRAEEHQEYLDAGLCGAGASTFASTAWPGGGWRCAAGSNFAVLEIREAVVAVVRALGRVRDVHADATYPWSPYRRRWIGLGKGDGGVRSRSARRPWGTENSSSTPRAPEDVLPVPLCGQPAQEPDHAPAVVRLAAATADPAASTVESDSSVAKSVSTAIESSFPAIVKPDKMKDKLTMAKKEVTTLELV